MTATPAMPELPKPFAYLCDWGNDSFGLPRQIVYYDEPGNAIDDDWNERPKVRQNEPFYTADQMRAYALATLQAQQSTQGDAQAFVTPAEVSDAEINRIACKAGFSAVDVEVNGRAFARFASAILALRPQAVPMTDEQAKQFLKRSALLDMFLHIGWYSAPRKGFDEHALSLIRAVEAHHGITAPAGGEKQA